MTYYQVFEYYPTEGQYGKLEIGKRLIYTFDNENAANEMMEFILKHDYLKNDLGIEEIEHSNNWEPTKKA